MNDVLHKPESKKCKLSSMCSVNMDMEIAETAPDDFRNISPLPASNEPLTSAQEPLFNGYAEDTSLAVIRRVGTEKRASSSSAHSRNERV